MCTQVLGPPLGSDLVLDVLFFRSSGLLGLRRIQLRQRRFPAWPYVLKRQMEICRAWQVRGVDRCRRKQHGCQRHQRQWCVFAYQPSDLQSLLRKNVRADMYRLQRLLIQET